MKHLRAVAFDLDGTLIRTSVDFRKMKRGIIRLFGSFGLDQSLFTVSDLTYVTIRRGLDLLASQGIPDAQIAEITSDITRIMNRVELESVSRVEPMPQVSETLFELRERGMKIGVITRGCRAYTMAALDKIGISDMVDGILARDDVDMPKPHPSHLIGLAKKLGVDPCELVLVGDHRTDYLCAKAAQVVFVGLHSESSDLEALTKGDPRAEIVGNLDDLPELLFRPTSRPSIISPP